MDSLVCPPLPSPSPFYLLTSLSPPPIPKTHSPHPLSPLNHQTFKLQNLTPSQPFHTEANGDILAWQTRAAAAEGGKCILASAYTAYNLLAATYPEVIHTLAKPDWPFA